MEKTCVTCGRDLVVPPTGRPPSYCSTRCRRVAEYELRRAQSLLLIAEKAEQKWRAELTAGFASVRVKELAAFWADEAERLCGRLSELLSGDPPEVSP